MTFDGKEQELRTLRNVLLTATDWTQLPDAPVEREAWATYRQQLRDLPQDPAWPDVIWPEAPGA